MANFMLDFFVESAYKSGVFNGRSGLYFVPLEEY